MDLYKSTTPGVAVSVASHRHGAQLVSLMRKLEEFCCLHLEHVILTINVPEPDLIAEINSQRWTFRLTVVKNANPKGFGANHNAALKYCSSEYFCILNPDLDFNVDPISVLITSFDDPLVGCAFPIQLDETGQIQDYARALPSPLTLLARYLGPEAGKKLGAQPDWVNGAFMLFRSEVFRTLNGFDERYFMYCEDVDICLRLQLAGFKLAQSEVSVVHAARRKTRVNFRHFSWHVASLIRLWTSAAYREFSVRLRAKND